MQVLCVCPLERSRGVFSLCNVRVCVCAMCVCASVQCVRTMYARAYTRAYPHQWLVVIMSKPPAIQELVIELPPHMILRQLKDELRRVAGIIPHPPVSPPPTLIVTDKNATNK